MNRGRQSLSARDRKKLIDRLQSDNRIVAAYLLGSAASGMLRPDSDIDVAILPQKGMRLRRSHLLELSTSVSLALGREIDLGVLSSANLVYARQAILAGTRLFTKDPFYSDLMETTLLSMYLWFSEERKEIVDAYRTR